LAGKATNLPFDLPRLRAGIKPFRLHWFPRLRSTNDHAAALRKRGTLFAPAMVLTGHQLAGRGRGSNTWWSGDGSVTVTFVFAADEYLAPYHVPLIAGLAARDAAAEVCGDDRIKLKWPNDLLYDGKKLTGLLCERVYKADLIGIGMNVNVDLKQIPQPLRSRVTGLSQIADRPIDPNELLIALARRLHVLLSNRNEQSFATILQAYDHHHALVDRKVTVLGSPGEPPIKGVCQGLDDMGRLLLRDRKTVHRVIAGHVQLDE